MRGRRTGGRNSDWCAERNAERGKKQRPPNHLAACGRSIVIGIQLGLFWSGRLGEPRSQLPIETWHEVIGEPTFADAILDRLVHNAYRLALDGPSMRKIKAGEAEGAELAVTQDADTPTVLAKPAKGSKR